MIFQRYIAAEKLYVLASVFHYFFLRSNTQLHWHLKFFIDRCKSYTGKFWMSCRRCAQKKKTLAHRKKPPVSSDTPPCTKKSKGPHPKITFAVLYVTEKTENTDKLEMNELQRRTLLQRILKPQKRGGGPVHCISSRSVHTNQKAKMWPRPQRQSGDPFDLAVKEILFPQLLFSFLPLSSPWCQWLLIRGPH